jgi:hypothetical protein
MPRRLLNIASIVCLVACVALMGLWVRSYRWCDELSCRFTDRQSFTLTSRPGRLLCTFTQAPTPLKRENSKVSAWSLMSSKYGPGFQPDIPHDSLGWKRAILLISNTAKPLPTARPTHWALVFSYWFLVLITGWLAMALRLRWPVRFSLRGLFAVTTFLAFVFGMIAWIDMPWIGK